jgi:2-amino-4-hydroxy-6-hydroxymethyldihydropteridine diphosphokinase
MKYFLSLGSNLGNRRANLARAACLLGEKGIDVLRSSSVYRTEPVDLPDQPWFYNQVLEIDAACNPLALLNVVKSIERAMKRTPTVDKGPRTIDIDILLAGRTVVQTRRLTVPHPRMDRRNFVLVPLREIAPHAVHPKLHERIDVLAKMSKDRAAVLKIGPAPAGRRAVGRPSKRATGRVSSGARSTIHLGLK